MEILTKQKHEELEIALQKQLLEQAKFGSYWSALENYFQQLPTPESLFFPIELPSN